MKKKRIISLILAAMFLMAMPAGVTSLASRPPSNWAVPEMNDANTTGLLTAGAAKDFLHA